MFTPRFPIMTDRLALRPFTEADLDALHAMQSREDVARFLYWGPRTREQVAEKLRERLTMTAIAEPGDTLLLAVTRDDVLLGDVNLQYHSAEHGGLAEIGYVFHPDHGGKGYAREAAREVLRMSFEDLGVHRVIGRLDAANERSANLLASLGMRKEAHFVRNEMVKGAWADEAVYAMLREEWPAR